MLHELIFGDEVKIIQNMLLVDCNLGLKIKL